MGGGGERGRLEGHCPFSREWSGSTMQIFIWRPWEPGEGFSCELSRRGAVCPYSCTLAYCKELGRVFWTGRRDILRFVHFCEALQSFCLLLCAFFFLPTSTFLHKNWEGGRSKSYCLWDREGAAPLLPAFLAHWSGASYQTVVQLQSEFHISIAWLLALH